MTSGGAFADAARALELRGRAILPGDLDYDEARAVWNAMHDRRPAVIVRAAGTADVLTSLRFGREHDLRIAVRGGGHNVAGNGTVEGGLVIDLGAMKSVHVDAARRVVRVEPGVTLGDLDLETEPFGLVVPVGVVTGTGVGGLTLGGGVGWLTRAYGLTIDSLLAADVVTADGRVVRASPEDDAELFWGVRGGGGNFGVVTSLEFRAYHLGPSVLAGNFIYGQSRWTEALRAYRSWTEGLPDQLTSIISFLRPHPDWDMGDEIQMFLGFTWAGTDTAEAERHAARLRAAAPPDSEVLEPQRWVAWQSQADALFPKGLRAYWKNASLDDLDDGAIEAIVEHAARAPALGSGYDIHHMGGAVSRVAEDATAFPNRSARFWLNMYGVWSDPGDDERGRTWAKGAHAALEPFASAGQYVNFLGAESPGGAADGRSQALAAYGPAKLARLVELKRRYDPDNVFRLNHNIPPD
jgi:FAD/FMN-containing dehydrogenase